MTDPRRGLAGRLAARSVSSRLTPLGVLAAIGLGLVSVLTTPREEEPQIIVPMVDVFVPMPGATPAEVEAGHHRLERRLWGIPGVEYVYSTSARDGRWSGALQGERAARSRAWSVNRNWPRMPSCIPPGVVGPIGQAALDRRCADPGRHAVVGALRATSCCARSAQSCATSIAEVPERRRCRSSAARRRQVRVEIDPRAAAAYARSRSRCSRRSRRTNARCPRGPVGRAARVDARGETRCAPPMNCARLVVVRAAGGPSSCATWREVTDGRADPALCHSAESRASRRAAGGHDRRRQAEGHQRHRRRGARRREARHAQGQLSRRTCTHDHPQLRRDRRGEVERAAVAHAARRALGVGADLARARPARGGWSC